MTFWPQLSEPSFVQRVLNSLASSLQEIGIGLFSLFLWFVLHYGDLQNHHINRWLWLQQHYACDSRLCLMEHVPVVIADVKALFQLG